MLLTVAPITRFLESLAPTRWAEDWDHVGLQLGRPDQEVARVVLALDVNLQTLRRGLLDRAQLVIAYHPLLFRPLAEIRTDTPQGRLVSELVRAELAVYAAHTNLDCASRVGPAAVLAERLGLPEAPALLPVPGEAQMKLVTFLPPELVPGVRQALAEAGAGILGGYRECAFHITGEGHFHASEDAQPVVGEAGAANLVPEARLEMLFPPAAQAAILAALRRTHPYEHPAIDLYPLAAPPSEAGVGRVGRLPAPLSAEDLAGAVAQALAVPSVMIAGEGLIETVALLPGSGRAGVAPALAAGAQALVTGELDYHETTQAVAAGLTVIAAGHAESEAPLLSALAAALAEEFGSRLGISLVPPTPTWRGLTAS